MYSIYMYLSTFDSFSFIISNTDKHEFSSIRKWISYSNDVMNHVDCVIKHDVYPQKKHSCSKNNRGILFFVLKIYVVCQKVYHGLYCMDIRLVEICIYLNAFQHLLCFPLTDTVIQSHGIK